MSLSLVWLLLVGNPTELFVRANRAYEAANYPEAIALYDSVAATVTSADVFFNRGNAWFKQGNVGRAIADYLRGYGLRPRDRDIRRNLAFARQFRPDKPPTLDSPVIRLVTDGLRILDLSTARLLAGGLFFLALTAAALGLVFRQRRFGFLAIGFGVIFLYCLLAQLSWNSVVDPNRVVVVVPELTLRAGPGPEYKEIVVVHDGLEALVRERRPQFVLIQIPGGEGGWAEASAVEQIFPGQ